MTGRLTLVGTPIGNLGDTSDRARETLRRSDLIACEDTRRTRRLLSALGIEGARLLSYFEGNEEKRAEELLGEVRAGREVALVTDAGMPALSDPGYRIVRACADAGIEVSIVPGPSAILSALVVSGLPTDRFCFEGYLPAKQGARRTTLEHLATEPRTIVLFEAPHRLAGALADAADIFGDRRGVVARELTKTHEEVVRGSLPELAERFADGAKGEITIVLEGAPPEPQRLDGLVERVRALVAEGTSHRDAVAKVAEDSGASRRALYEASLEP